MCNAVQAKDQNLSVVTVCAWIRDKLLNMAKKVNAKPKKETDGNTDNGLLHENAINLNKRTSLFD